MTITPDGDLITAQGSLYFGNEEGNRRAPCHAAGSNLAPPFLARIANALVTRQRGLHMGIARRAQAPASVVHQAP